MFKIIGNCLKVIEVATNQTLMLQANHTVLAIENWTSKNKLFKVSWFSSSIKHKLKIYFVFCVVSRAFWTSFNKTANGEIEKVVKFHELDCKRHNQNLLSILIDTLTLAIWV